MNHEQMINSDGKSKPMQECDNSNAEMNHEQMSSEEHQMSMQQCDDNSNTEMNHEQMMNSGEDEMPMPNNSPMPAK